MQAIVFDLDETLFTTENTLHAGVEELLCIVQNLGLKIGALTTGDHRALVRLAEAGIRNHFDHVLCTDNTDKPKGPDSLAKLLNSLGAEAHNSVLVSHMQSDITLAKDAGLAKTIQVAHGPVARYINNAKADHVVQDIPAVLDVLE